MSFTDDPDRDAEERDSIFMSRYLTYEAEGRKDAAVRACIDARLQEHAWPIDVTAERTLERLAGPLNALRRIFKPKTVPESVTLETGVADMQAVYQAALLDKQYAPAIKAKETQFKLVGLLKPDGPTVNVNISAKMLSDDQLQQIAAGKTIDAPYTEVEEPKQLTQERGLGSL